LANPRPIALLTVFLLVLAWEIAGAQQITGVWKGRIQSTRIELKLVKKGDSLEGTSYYYESRSHYRRYAVKGYFDDRTNGVVWWDDRLIEKMPARLPGEDGSGSAQLAVANFNCPGDGVMKLEGRTSLRDDKDIEKSPVDLQKSSGSVFQDEWNFVLDNYLVGANDPYIIDSIAGLSQPHLPSYSPMNEPQPQSQAIREEPLRGALVVQTDKPLPVQTNEERFSSRVKILQQVITVTGDSLEMSFYDNAEIDGDSISLFMNGRKIFEHLMLTDRPFTVKFAVAQLLEDNEAVMVAENLGSIPPNTALMIALVGGKRYEAHLYSTMNSSALIRFVKEPPGSGKN
jgi:hypothetical protein